MKADACDQCKELGVLGPEIRAYSFVKPDGSSYVALLHASDGGRDCYSKYRARYQAKYDAAVARMKAEATNVG